MPPLDWGAPFEITSDASNYVMGAMLGQKKEDKMHTIYYASRSLYEAQINYATTKKTISRYLFHI